VRYVTRERAHVDRIATAWAIRRFVDPEATFTFVRRTVDVSEIDGTPFDIRGAALSHKGERCTFEVLIDQHGLDEPALVRMGPIVRGADLPHEDGRPPESDGVRAVFDAIRDAAVTDDERLRIGGEICDALYAYCRSATESD
jgi:hypothetical protein